MLNIWATSVTATNREPLRGFSGWAGRRLSRRSVSQANEPEHRITFTAREARCLRRQQRKEDGRSAVVNRLDLSPSGTTTRNAVEGVSPTTEGRRECLSQAPVTGRNGHGADKDG